MTRALGTPATEPVHTIGRIPGAGGGELMVGVDCDGVTVATTGYGAIVLDHADREDFARAYFEAVRLADAWAQRYGGAPVPP